MKANDYRQALADYLQTNAQPPDKFSHQPRVYLLARRLAENQPFDDDVLYAAAWLHDLGVFTGHRPEDPAALAAWDNVAYAAKQAPRLLQQLGFSADKIPAVQEAIRTHLPSGHPTSFEGVLLRDADLLEQLGAIGILRCVCKVGRDTRFAHFGQALQALRRQMEALPAQLRLASAVRLVEPRLAIMRAFLEAAQTEADGVEW